MFASFPPALSFLSDSHKTPCLAIRGHGLHRRDGFYRQTQRLPANPRALALTIPLSQSLNVACTRQQGRRIVRFLAA